MGGEKLIADLQVQLVETEQVLQVYKAALFHANRKLEEIKCKKKLRLVSSNEGNREGARNPLELLPKELWASILETRLKTWSDLKSCYDTCQLFRDLLEDSKNLWLFEAILPLITPHLPTSAVLKCRRVCQTWRLQVDSSSPNLNQVHFPFHQDSQTRLRRKWEEMGAYPHCPFIGGRVAIWQSPEDLGELNGGPLVEEEVAAAFVDDLRFFLNCVSEHIVHMELNVNEQFLGEAELVQIVVSIVTKCQNLRSFSILGMDSVQFLELGHIRAAEVDALIPEPFTVPPKLKALKIFSVWDFAYTESRIFQRCHRQLKKVETASWSDLYSSMHWTCLEELDIRDKLRYGVHRELPLYQWLLEVDAPKLARLGVPVRKSESLLELLRVVKHFPKLGQLVLHGYSSFDGFSLTELATVPEDLKAPERLEALDIYMEHRLFERSFNFRFLVCFPCLKYLSLTLATLATNVRQEKNDVLELSSEWLQPCWIYHSNVWKWFPVLETLAISTGSGRNCVKIVHTRREYNNVVKSLITVNSNSS